MERDDGLSIGRRALLLGASATAGLALSGALGRFGLLGDAGPSPLDHRACLERLLSSLSEPQRKLLCFPWDHPARQITNTAAVFKRPHLGTVLGAEQRALVQVLAASMLSEPGRHALGPTIALEAGGIDGCNLAIYGSPRERGLQASISGGHLHLRSPDASAAGVAFGGAIAYGHQTGNKQFKIPGNSFAFQSDLANRIYAALDATQRAAARVADAQVEYVLQTQSGSGRFAGVPVAGMNDAQRAATKALLDGIFAAYPEPAQAQAWSFIEHNGGLAALHVAFFEHKGFYADGKTFAELDAAERARRPDPYFQVWRVEGPGTVIHFKGSPHVHAYINIVRDAGRECVGEAVAQLDATLEGDALRKLVQTALARQTGTELGYSGDEVNARLCPGEVTTGALWNLDPYDNNVSVATIAPEAMAPPLRAALAAQGMQAAAPRRPLRVATLDYFAHSAEEFGRALHVEPAGVSMRELLVAYVRKHGLGGTAERGA
jgi:hypothetical protein